LCEGGGGGGVLLFFFGGGWLFVLDFAWFPSYGENPMPVYGASTFFLPIGGGANGFVSSSLTTTGGGFFFFCPTFCLFSVLTFFF